MQNRRSARIANKTKPATVVKAVTKKVVVAEPVKKAPVTKKVVVELRRSTRIVSKPAPVIIKKAATKKEIIAEPVKEISPKKIVKKL